MMHVVRCIVNSCIVRRIISVAKAGHNALLCTGLALRGNGLPLD